MSQCSILTVHVTCHHVWRVSGKTWSNTTWKYAEFLSATWKKRRRQSWHRQNFWQGAKNAEQYTDLIIRILKGGYIMAKHWLFLCPANKGGCIGAKLSFLCRQHGWIYRGKTLSVFYACLPWWLCQGKAFKSKGVGGGGGGWRGGEKEEVEMETERERARIQAKDLNPQIYQWNKITYCPVMPKAKWYLGDIHPPSVLETPVWMTKDCRHL